MRLARWPRHVFCILAAAFIRCLSKCLFSRSAWASDTVLVALDTTAGLQAVLANGLPAWPLRLTLRGRFELPVNVENISISRMHLTVAKYFVLFVSLPVCVVGSGVSGQGLCSRRFNMLSQHKLRSSLAGTPSSARRWKEWGTGTPVSLLMRSQFIQLVTDKISNPRRAEHAASLYEPCDAVNLLRPPLRRGNSSTCAPE